MNAAERQSIATIPLILLIGGAIAWAGSQGAVRVAGLPLFAMCGVFSFVINWLVFVPAYTLQTERYFDLTGSATYACVVVMALVLGNTDARAILLGTMILMWAVRLGSFLFMRISADGSDGRFDELKPSFPRFLMTWTLQGLWVFLTAACALAAMTSASPAPLDAFAWIGALVWIGGFALETVADRQKSRFRANPANRDRFIQEGLWAWSRHPNYFGEIMLWSGVAIVALPVLSGWQYATLISPIFVYVLLTRISGIPMLESRASKRWGSDPVYRAFKARTPALWPRPPRSG